MVLTVLQQPNETEMRPLTTVILYEIGEDAKGHACIQSLVI